MLNQDQSETLLYNLSSIFRDFLPVDNTLLKLYDIYATTINYVWNLYGEAGDSRFISTARTLSTIPYFKLSVDDAIYDLATANLIANLGIEDQIAYLDKENLSSSFVFSKKDASGDPSVYSMRLLVNFSDEEPMQMYKDYFIRNNRLYLLPSFIQSRKQVFHYLHAFDIKLNDFTLEKNFGTQFDLVTGPLLSRFEYRDVLEAFLRSFKGNLTIKDIKDSIHLATKWETFDVQDYKSPTISPGKLNLYQNYIISPLKFLVTLPESLIPEKVMVNVVRTLLNEVKEAQTDYMVFFDIDRPNNVFPELKKSITVKYPRTDHQIGTDTFAMPTTTLKVVDTPFDLFGRYDTTFYVDQNLDFDDPPANEIVNITTSPLVIPRNFRLVAGNDITTFACNSNQDATSQFELHGSAVNNGPYTLLQTVNNDPTIGTISFTYNANSGGNVYYNSRSKDPNGNYSFFTLPLTAQSFFGSNPMGQGKVTVNAKVTYTGTVNIFSYGGINTFNYQSINVPFASIGNVTVYAMVAQTASLTSSGSGNVTVSGIVTSGVNVQADSTIVTQGKASISVSGTVVRDGSLPLATVSKVAITAAVNSNQTPGVIQTGDLVITSAGNVTATSA